MRPLPPPVLRGPLATGRWTRDQWIEANPLRKWRKARLLTAAQVATACGVAWNAYSGWETGMSRPGAVEMARIAELIDTAQFDLELRWSQWYDQRPRVETPRREESE